VIDDGNTHTVSIEYDADAKSITVNIDDGKDETVRIRVHGYMEFLYDVVVYVCGESCGGIREGGVVYASLGEDVLTYVLFLID